MTNVAGYYRLVEFADVGTRECTAHIYITNGRLMFRGSFHLNGSADLAGVILDFANDVRPRDYHFVEDTDSSYILLIIRAHSDSIPRIIGDDDILIDLAFVPEHEARGIYRTIRAAKMTRKDAIIRTHFANVH